MSQMIIWKDRVDQELQTAAQWEDNWGFLRAPRRLPRHPKKDKSGTLTKSASSPGLASAGQAMVQGGAPSGGDAMFSGSDPVFGDRIRVLWRATQVPKSRFPRPISTSQEIGWAGGSLEKFGV